MLLTGHISQFLIDESWTTWPLNGASHGPVPIPGSNHLTRIIKRNSIPGRSFQTTKHVNENSSVPRRGSLGLLFGPTARTWSPSVSPLTSLGTSRMEQMKSGQSSLQPEAVKKHSVIRRPKTSGTQTGGQVEC